MSLKAANRNALIKIYADNKETIKFDSGLEIYHARGWNFNKREDSPSIAEIIDGEGLPKGGECLIHHNSFDESYRVPHLSQDGVDIYSLPLDMIFFFREKGGEWQPMKDFLITLRLWKPYSGFLVGVDAELVKNRLYVVSGKVEDAEDLIGKVVAVTNFSDYEIIFHEDGKPKSLIRTRGREILGVDNLITENIKNYLVGINLRSAIKFYG